jgi:hypothetical protein
MNGRQLTHKDIGELVAEEQLLRGGFQHWHNNEEWYVKLAPDGRISQVYALAGSMKHNGQNIRYYKEM